MNCIEAQELITDVVSDRRVEDDRAPELDRHLAQCGRCRAELELGRATRATLRRASQPVAITSRTADGIRALIDREDTRDSVTHLPSTHVTTMLRQHPWWSSAAAVVAVIGLLYLWPRPDGERRFNESSVAFIQQAVASYNGLVSESSPLQMRTSDEQELRSFFASKGVTCEILIPRLSGATLVGGSVTIANRTHVAHVVYRCGQHYVCLCQLKMADVCPTNRTALSDSARSCVCAGQWYWYRPDAQRSVGLWKYDDTLCAATSDCEPTEISALFTASK